MEDNLLEVVKKILILGRGLTIQQDNGPKHAAQTEWLRSERIYVSE